MLSSKLVEEIVVSLKEYPHVTEDQSLQDAINKMLSHSGPKSGAQQISELAVLNSRGEITGTLSRQQLLIAMEPKMLQNQIESYEGFTVDFSSNAILWEEPFFAKCGERLSEKVADYSKPVTTVLKSTDSVLKALYIMLNTRKELLPVEDKQKVIGVIDLSTVFALVANCCSL